jgi:hypothetical protein
MTELSCQVFLKYVFPFLSLSVCMKQFSGLTAVKLSLSTWRILNYARADNVTLPKRITDLIRKPCRRSVLQNGERSIKIGNEYKFAKILQTTAWSSEVYYKYNSHYYYYYYYYYYYCVWNTIRPPLVTLALHLIHDAVKFFWNAAQRTAVNMGHKLIIKGRG